MDHPRKRPLTIAIVAVCAVLTAAFIARWIDQSTSFASTAELTSAQLSEATTYYEDNNGRIDYGRPVGCDIDSLGASAAPQHEVIAYTIVTCQACPVTSSFSRAGEYPAVFKLRGLRILGVQEANAPGDPDFQNEINRIFPQSLQTQAANNSPASDWSVARSRAPCQPSR